MLPKNTLTATDNNKRSLRASPKDFKFYFSNMYLLTNVTNKRVKKYDILQKTL